METHNQNLNRIKQDFADFSSAFEKFKDEHKQMLLNNVINILDNIYNEKNIDSINLSYERCFEYATPKFKYEMIKKNDKYYIFGDPLDDNINFEFIYKLYYHLLPLYNKLVKNEESKLNNIVTKKF
jgi:hypothetical protein